MALVPEEAAPDFERYLGRAEEATTPLVRGRRVRPEGSVALLGPAMPLAAEPALRLVTVPLDSREDLRSSADGVRRWRVVGAGCGCCCCCCCCCVTVPVRVLRVANVPTPLEFSPMLIFASALALVLLPSPGDFDSRVLCPVAETEDAEEGRSAPELSLTAPNEAL